MKKFNYTADIHYQIDHCYLTDSFDQLEKALNGTDVKNHRILLISEKTYFGFYKDQLTQILSALFKNLDVFEFETADCKYEEELKKAMDLALEIPLTDGDWLFSLGGHPADALSKMLIVESGKTLSYVQLPVTFTSQLIAGKDPSYILEFSGAHYGELKEKAMQIRADLIYINLHTYKYLSTDERLSGMGEVLRHAVSCDRQLFEFLEQNIGKKTDNFSAYLMTMIGNHLEDQELDIKDSRLSLRSIYGYTIARALEKCTNYIIPHGSAVGIGMVVANSIAAKRGLISDEDNFRIARLMVSHGLSVSMNFTNELIEAICAAIQSEEGLVDETETLKEFVFIDRIGHTTSVQDVTLDEIKDVMNYRKISH